MQEYLNKDRKNFKYRSRADSFTKDNFHHEMFPL